MTLCVALDRPGVPAANAFRKGGERKPFPGEVVLELHGKVISHIGQTLSSHIGQPGQDVLSQFGYLNEMGELPNNIRPLRILRGLTLEQLAALTEHPKPGQTTDLTTIQKLELGKRKLTQEWMERIASALGADPADLLKAAPSARPARKVPRVGAIPGGNWKAAIEEPLDLIPTTKGGPNTFALTVEGDSMDRVVEPGTTIFIDPDDRELVDEKYYAVMRPGGEATFKQFRTGPMRLEPCSRNTDHKTIPLGEEPLITIGRVVGYEGDL